MFVVAKSSGAQREVWRGKRVSAAVVPPPRPELLASPTAFRAIELEQGEVLRVSKRVGRCFSTNFVFPITCSHTWGGQQCHAANWPSTALLPKS